jgi:chromosome condensin MukBEF MukE localization factor
VIAAKGFDAGDAILRAAIREQVGSTVKRLHRNGAIENIGAGRASKWRLAERTENAV